MALDGFPLKKMTGKRTRQTRDAILTSSEHPIALSHTPMGDVSMSPWLW